MCGWTSSRLERDDFSSNRHPALSFYLRMISPQTLRVCREGKPVPTFPDHALARSRPHASLARAHDGLGPVGDIQLIEDAIDVIANGFWAYRQLACDRCIVEAASDQFEDLTFALRKFGKRHPFGSLGPTLTMNEAGDFGQELFPRRLVLQQD